MCLWWNERIVLDANKLFTDVCCVSHFSKFTQVPCSLENVMGPPACWSCSWGWQQNNFSVLTPLSVKIFSNNVFFKTPLLAFLSYQVFLCKAYFFFRPVFLGLVFYSSGVCVLDTAFASDWLQPFITQEQLTHDSFV